METLLMIVTVVALALAIGMSALAWRLLRESRRRSAARIEALQTLAEADQGPERFATLEDDELDVELRDVEIAPADRWEHRRGSRPPVFLEPAAALQTQPVPDLVRGSVRRSRRVQDAAPLFEAPPQPAAARRWVSVVAAAAIMGALVSGVYMLSRPAVAAESRLSGWVPALGAGTPRPLELLSLSHHADAGTFTVTGLVQNPSEGMTVRKAVAVIYLFDRDGNYFATGKAPLDFDQLRPGDESPFIVRVPSSGRVGRYRVGFRLEEGGVVAHIDRRGQPPAGMTGDSLDAPAIPREAAIGRSEGRP
jgi:hypothetical protein